MLSLISKNLMSLFFKDSLFTLALLFCCSLSYAKTSSLPVSCEDVYTNFFANQETLLQTQQVHPTKDLRLVQRSTSSPEGLEETLLVLYEKSSRQQQVVFSSLSLPEASKSQIIKFSVNRNRTFVAVGYVVRGSIDRYSIAIVDLSNGQMKGLVQNLAWGGVLDWTISWRTNSILSWSQAPREFDVTSGAVQDSVYRLKGIQNDISVYSKKSDSTSSLYFILPDGREVAFSNAAFGYGLDVSILGMHQNHIYFRDLDGMFQRFRIPDQEADLKTVQLEKISLRLPLRDPSLSPDDPTSYRSVLSLTLQQDRFFVKSAWGLQQYLTVYQNSGARLFEVAIPQYSSLVQAQHIGGTQYKIKLESAVRTHEFVFDSTERTLDRPEIRNTMLTDQHGFKIQTRVVEVSSADGTKVPVRITSPEQIQMDHSNPVLLQLYGGFGIRGPVDPKFNSHELEFLKRGGVLVNAGIRGGSEFGPLWYTAGTSSKQQNKLDDLIATARWIHSSGLARPEKIITLSGSNGGYVIVSSALQAPDAFGLVIPVNGIYDLANPQKAKSLRSEYGDPTVAKDLEYLLRISPLALAQNYRGPRPDFFILRGSADSRVEPQESLDLAETLRQSTGPVEVVTIPDAGHLMQRPQIQRRQSILFHQALWSKIYQYLGFTE